MQELLLALILVVAIFFLVRFVWRSLSSTDDPSKPPSCAGCPFDSKCQMQDKPHAEPCGSESDDV